MAKLVKFIWKPVPRSTNYSELTYNCASSKMTLEYCKDQPNFCFKVYPDHGFLNIGNPLSSNKFDAGFIFDNGVKYMFNENNIDECKKLYYFLEHFIKTGEANLNYEETLDICNLDDIIF